MKNLKNIKKFKIFLTRVLKSLFSFSGYFFGLLFIFFPRDIILKFMFFLSNRTKIFNFLFYNFNQASFRLIKFKFGSSYIASKKLVSGSEIKLDITKNTQRQMYFWKIYEPHITNFLVDNLKKGDWSVDIGANIGYHTLLMSDFVGENGKVFAFEPEELNFTNLKENINHSNKKNIIAEKMAIGSEDNLVRLNINPHNEGGHSLVPDYSGKEGIMVKVVRLDNYFKNLSLEEIQRIKSVKIDVEGFELEVFIGMNRLLESASSLSVICEISRNKREILEIMKKIGYSPFLLNNDGTASFLEDDFVYRSSKRDILFTR